MDTANVAAPGVPILTARGCLGLYQRTPGGPWLAVAMPGRSDCGGDLCLGRPLMAPELVGRASEIAVVESLLAGLADGGGSLLVLGDPGIGKSALVEAAARRAADAGMRVLACAGVPSEAQFSFAGLHAASFRDAAVLRGWPGRL